MRYLERQQLRPKAFVQSISWNGNSPSCTNWKRELLYITIGLGCAKHLEKAMSRLHVLFFSLSVLLVVAEHLI